MQDVIFLSTHLVFGWQRHQVMLETSFSPETLFLFFWVFLIQREDLTHPVNFRSVPASFFFLGCGQKTVINLESILIRSLNHFDMKEQKPYSEFTLDDKAPEPVFKTGHSTMAAHFSCRIRD